MLVSFVNLSCIISYNLHHKSTKKIVSVSNFIYILIIWSSNIVISTINGFVVASLSSGTWRKIKVSITMYAIQCNNSFAVI